VIDMAFRILAALVPIATGAVAVLISTGWAALIASSGSIAIAVLGYLKARHIAEIGANATVTAAEKSAAAAKEAAETAASAAANVAEIAGDVAKQTNAKSVLVGTVTAERATWRSEMRDATVTLATLLRLAADRKGLDRPALYAALSKIRLRLNPSGRDADRAVRNEHPLDRDIHSILEHILNVDARAHDVQGALAKELERLMALLLKQEWKVSKSEATTGELGGGDVA
jgi:hypothetical protein